MYRIHHHISIELSVNDINDACRLGIEIGVYSEDDDTWKQGVCIYYIVLGYHQFDRPRRFYSKTTRRFLNGVTKCWHAPFKTLHDGNTKTIKIWKWSGVSIMIVV